MISNGHRLHWKAQSEVRVNSHQCNTNLDQVKIKEFPMLRSLSFLKNDTALLKESDTEALSEQTVHLASTTAMQNSSKELSFCYRIKWFLV